MKITLTGSLGHISKPLAQELLEKGHLVTIISSKAERQRDIEAMGATAAIGKMEDPEFLTKTFAGSDVIYCMETLGQDFFFNKELDYLSAVVNIGKSYKQAIRQSNVKRVIHLSSIGAHTNKGNGMLAFHYEVEQILKTLPEDVIIKFMRPVGFYYNTFAFINAIKTQGTIFSNYDGDEKEPWVSPLDIAAVIAEEIEKPFEKRLIRYIASDEVSPNEVAKMLGEAIGKPELKWAVISDEQRLKNLLSIGMNLSIAKGLTEMDAGRRGGKLYEDYYLHRPAVFGKIKMKDFAKEFATVYSNLNNTNH